jgi:hypothetical protein
MSHGYPLVLGIGIFLCETVYMLDECLTHFLKLSDYHQSIEEIIGHIPSNSSEPDSKLDIAGALQRLTYPHLPSGLSGVMNATTLAAFSEDESPFSSEMMDTIMKVRNLLIV